MKTTHLDLHNVYIGIYDFLNIFSTIFICSSTLNPFLTPILISSDNF